MSTLIHRLGKKAARLDPRTLSFGRYRGAKERAALPTPTEASWLTKVPADSWPMFDNDTLGDCVIAAMAHMIQQETTYTGGVAKILTDAQIISAYSAIGGYVPGDPSTDNGCDMLTALEYWKSTGMDGHKISAYVSIDWTNFQEVIDAIYLFGALFLGVQLPTCVQGASAWTVPQGGTSTPTGAAGSWGGHCVPILAASRFSLPLISWGGVYKMSHNFLLDYADEAYAVISADWINNVGLSPAGFNLPLLEQDLNAIAKL